METYSVKLTLSDVLLLTDLEQKIQEWKLYSEDFGVLTEEEKQIYCDSMDLLQRIYNETRGKQL